MIKDLAGFNPANPNDWEKVRVEKVKASGMLCPSSGFLFSVSLQSSGGNATAVCYDGQNTNGKVIQATSAAQNCSQHDPNPLPRRFNSGLYVALGSNIGHLVVQYIADKELQPK